jgi:hypothetical protein
MKIENRASCEIRSVVKILNARNVRRLKFVGKFVKFMVKML